MSTEVSHAMRYTRSFPFRMQLQSKSD